MIFPCGNAVLNSLPFAWTSIGCDSRVSSPAIARHEYEPL